MDNIFIPRKPDKQKSIDVKTEEASELNTVNMSDMLDTIPANCISKPDSELAKTQCEWRWRFYRINGKGICEISHQDIGKERQYLNSAGKWIPGDNKKLEKIRKSVEVWVQYFGMNTIP